MKNIEDKSNSINIVVDYRTELLGIIQIISNYRNKYSKLIEITSNKEYIDKINKEFTKYNNHPVVLAFNHLIDKYDFGYDLPINLFLQLDNDLNSNKISDYISNKIGNDLEEIYDFIRMLPSFSDNINFEKFYNENKELYGCLVNSVKSNIDDYNVISFMTNYLGFGEEKEYIVNLLPFSMGSYGSNNENKIYSNIGVINNNGNIKDMYNYNDLWLSSTILHEYSHSFINPITSKYNIIDDNDVIFNNIKESMDKLAYFSNATIINEHIIRAIELRFLYYNKEFEQYDFFVEKEKESGFIYIENILNSLKEYEKNRSIYKAIEDFYPVIINNMVDEYQLNNRKK